CLPPNATHLCQPLDVCFFRPMKNKWRSILGSYKNSLGTKSQSIQKDSFPSLLGQLLDSLSENIEANVVSGFRKTGIHPINPQPVLSRL
ncbi:hypothetical protein LSAT2_026325, partial [Lamellibrachia satsuma]